MGPLPAIPVERVLNPARVNAFMNDPAIRPTIGGQGELDASNLLADTRNICLMSDMGGAMFAWRGPGIYEGHSFLRVAGAQAINVGREILDRMFEHADMIWGCTPEHLRHARWFNRKLGFSSLGMIDTPEGRCELFRKDRPWA